MTISARSLARLIIFVAVAMGTGRICSTQFVLEPSLYKLKSSDPVGRTWPTERPEPTPMFSSNDKSRWALVAALVDDGTFAIGHREERKGETPPYRDSGNDVIFDQPTGKWKSLDIVLRPDTNEFLSSKPPLLAVLVAGLYWLLKMMTGWTLTSQPFLVVRTILLVVNLVPFAIYLVVLDRWLGRYARSDWTRLAILSAAAFGTIVTPFLVTLNNHVLGTYAAMFALDAVLAIHHALVRPTAEVPRLDSAAIQVLPNQHAPVRPTWHRYLAAGFFAAFAAANELPALSLTAAVFAFLAWTDWRRTLLFALPPALVVAAAYFGTNYAEMGQLRPAYAEFGQASGGWYDYPGSYWKQPKEGDPPRPGIDWARMHESRAMYAFNVLVGHHGFFSLTPIWLLAVAGMFVRASSEGRGLTLPRLVPLATAAITAMVIGFYLYKSDNYSGWSNGLRWLMWLAPLLLVTMIPVVDRLGASRRGRWVVYVLLAMSVFSAHYTLWNPYRHPWIYDLAQTCGWSGYNPPPPKN